MPKSKKDFQKWHDKKARIDDTEKRPFFHEREVWFCHIGANVGFEQDGIGDDFLRPVIVFRKFSNKIFWAIPLTKVDKEMNEKTAKYYFSFFLNERGKNRAILSQIRLMDARRLGYLIGEISEEDVKDLTKKFKGLLP